MMQQRSDKYTIAWFKLAEFVARGERERAMGIYRLLTHSLPHRGLSLQLEGDLLLSFNDSCERVLACYRQAAQLYEQEGKVDQACALYEHCIALIPDNKEIRESLCALYYQQGEIIRALRGLQEIITKIAAYKSTSDIVTIIDLCNQYQWLSEKNRCLLACQTTLVLLAAYTGDPKTVVPGLLTLLAWAEQYQQHELFKRQLKESNELVYTFFVDTYNA